jgi:hypothetical protein
VAKVRATFRITNRPTQAWLNLNAELRALKASGGGIYVKAGFLSSEEEGREDGVNNATVAAINEYGTDTIPARPFVGPTFDGNQQKYEALMRQWIGWVLSGHASFKQGMGLLGLEMVSDIRKYVTEGNPVPPPNAPSVLAEKLKGSSGSPWGVRTLVWTGQMIGSMTHAVVTGKKPSGEGD